MFIYNLKVSGSKIFKFFAVTVSIIVVILFILSIYKIISYLMSIIKWINFNL